MCPNEGVKPQTKDGGDRDIDREFLFYLALIYPCPMSFDIYLIIFFIFSFNLLIFYMLLETA